MTLDHVWKAYCAGGYAAAVQHTPATALENFYLALLAFGEQEFEQAARYAQTAAALDAGNAVFTEAAAYLLRVVSEGKQRVYISGEGFAAFIRGGGNIPLYQQTSKRLRQVYQQYDGLTLLDIGVGDGRALLPALTENIERLDLVEPSAVMLGKTCQALDERGVRYSAACAPVQDFLQQSRARWDVAQATYSLHSIPPDERAAVLRRLRAQADRLVIVEFDVPEFSSMYAPEHMLHVIERYREGLAEYAHDGGMVAQGFLLPVLFGYFDRSKDRVTYEQPLPSWLAQLNAAGFVDIETQGVYPYWWATAHLIDAR